MNTVIPVNFFLGERVNTLAEADCLPGDEAQCRGGATHYDDTIGQVVKSATALALQYLDTMQISYAGDYWVPIEGITHKKAAQQVAVEVMKARQSAFEMPFVYDAVGGKMADGLGHQVWDYQFYLVLKPVQIIK